MVEDEVVWYGIWLSQRRYRGGSYGCTSQADDLEMVSKAELYSHEQLSLKPTTS
jgi:hypothetical protein